MWAGTQFLAKNETTVGRPARRWNPENNGRRSLFLEYGIGRMIDWEVGYYVP